MTYLEKELETILQYFPYKLMTDEHEFIISKLLSLIARERNRVFEEAIVAIKAKFKGDVKKRWDNGNIGGTLTKAHYQECIKAIRKLKHE